VERRSEMESYGIKIYSIHHLVQTHSGMTGTIGTASTIRTRESHTLIASTIVAFLVSG
jgi:hypothetical protein